jgi:hypothetical protein
VASATSINKVAITAPATSATLTIANGKTLTASNTLTFTGTDGSTLAVGAGGTLGSNAYTSTAYAPLASPTFTGTVVIPTPFTLGATSVTTTGTKLNYLTSATGTTGTTSTNLVFSASPTFTGTVTHPTPFTLGATSVTTTGTQLNYLNAATGTTGTTSSNVVFSASPTLTGATTVGSIGTINSIATQGGFGVSAIVDTVESGTRSTTYSATTLTGTTVAGFYDVQYYVSIVTAGSAVATVTVLIDWDNATKSHEGVEIDFGATANHDHGQVTIRHRGAPGERRRAQRHAPTRSSRPSGARGRARPVPH